MQLFPVQTCRVGVISDIHYASALERARGDNYELQGIANPLLRWVLHGHRHFVWMRQPLQKGYLLDRFLEQAVPMDYLVGNGDYSCDSGFTGLSDAAARQSTAECLEKLRTRFGETLLPTIGDHELGKRSFVGGSGGMRIESWRVATEELRLLPCWRVDVGRYTLIGIVSSLVALPLFEADTLPAERAEWRRLRELHLAEIRRHFESMDPRRRVVLFCHDPSALPFLKRDPVVGIRLAQIEQTFVGHLHTNLVMRASRMLAAAPFLWFPGHSGKRMASALREARCWRDFNVRLCPALAGVELLKDGGYWTFGFDGQARVPARYQFHPVRR